MNKKGQFVTVFFAALLIAVVLAVFSLEANNLQSSQNINVLQSSATSSNDIIANLASQYSFFQSILPSSEAQNSFMLSMGAIAADYFSNYGITFTNGLSISSGTQISSMQTLALRIINTQSLATSSPFQQQVVLDSAQYSQYEANNLQNVQFIYPNGTVIPSWLESGNLAYPSQSPAGSISTPMATPPTKTITVSFWVDPINNSYWGASGNYWEDVLSSGSGCPSSGFFFLIESGSNPPTESWSIRNSTGTLFRDFPGQKLAQGVWQNLVGVYNGADLFVYYNGKLVGSPVPADGPLQAQSQLTISGTHAVTSGPGCNPVSGSLANVQIYNASLSSSQIASIYYNGLNGGPVDKSKLLAYYPLAGNANDYSGNGNTGTAYNIEYNGAGSASTSSTYWLKLGSIPALSSTTVYMTFDPKNYNTFNTINTGEAPQLSPIYAEYDDGANVFNNYWNFAETALPSGWTATNGYVPYTINNGITFTATNAGGCFGQTTTIASTSTFSANAIMDFYGSLTGSGSTSSCYYGGIGFNTGWGSGNFGTIGTGNAEFGLITASSSSDIFTFPQPSGNVVYSVIASTSSTTAQANYTTQVNPSSEISSGIPIEMSFQSSSNIGGTIYWLRTRAYPPNGFMPMVVASGLT